MLAWGDNALAKFLKPESELLTPERIEFQGQVKDVIAGSHYPCVLFNNGTVHSSGHDNSEDLTKSLAGLEITDIFGGANHAFARSSNGRIYGWGENAKCQLGSADDSQIVVIPKDVEFFKSTRVVQVACGKEHTLVLTCDGATFVMGDNTYGQLGLGNNRAYEKPTKVTSLEGLPLAHVSAGGWHSFCVTFSGAVFSWGRNNYGQLGLGDRADKSVPTHLTLLTSHPVAFVAAGDHHTVVLTKKGGVFTFGSSLKGQLGHGATSECEANPRKVSELMGSVVTQVACGDNHTVAYVPGSQNIFSWGCGEKGQLGLGDCDVRSEPAMIKGPWRDSMGTNTKSPQEQQTFVKQIVAAGNQAFVILAKDSSDHPLDLRNQTERRKIYTLCGGLYGKISQLAEEDPVPPEVAKELKCVLSSASCMNASLFAPGCCVDEKSPGVDLDEAKRVFSEIVNCKNKEVLIIVESAVKDLLLVISGLSPIGLDALRIFLILPELFILLPVPPELPSFTEFVTKLLQLSKIHADVLDQWYRSLTAEHFSAVVNLCKKYIIANIKTNVPTPIPLPPFRSSGITNELLKVLAFIQKLDGINRMDNSPIAGFQEFYIPELSVFNYLVVEYDEWVQRRSSICQYSLLLDAKAKCFLLEIDSLVQRRREAQSHPFAQIREITGQQPAGNTIVVSRNKIVEDSLEKLKGFKNLKLPFYVVFDGEEGQDYGGVRKEYFMLVLEKILNPQCPGLFKENEDSCFLWFSDVTLDDLTTFVGTICGLAIYSSTIININFPLALYKKLLGKDVTLEDLKKFDPMLGCNLQQLLDYEEEEDDTVEDTFCLFFTAPGTGPGCAEVELKENGAVVPVTAANRVEYVDAYVDHIFNKSVSRQFECFRKGFIKVCGGKVLDLFRPEELMEMITGNENYDWKEMEKTAEYDGYTSSDQVIMWFWEVLHSMTLEEKKNFLIFLTGCSKVPLEGLRLSIRRRDEEDLLPVAHTCFDPLQLYLPCYSSKDILERKLKMSMSCKGFHIA